MRDCGCISSPVLWLAALLLVSTAGTLEAHDPHDPVVTVALSPNFVQDQTVFAATGQLSLKFGIYALMKSTDAGATWAVVGGFPNNSQVNSIVFSPNYANDGTIYAAGVGGLVESTNQGSSWVLRLNFAMTTMAVSPDFANDGTIFAIHVQNTILMSNTRGKSWTMLPAPSPLTAGLTSIAVSSNYAVDHTLLVGSAADGIFLSTNNGISWTPQVSGAAAPAISGLAFSPGFASDRTAYATSYGAGALVSTDGGANWMVSNGGIIDTNLTSVTLSPTYLTDSTLWVTAGTGGVFESNDLGNSWAAGVSVSRTLSDLTCIHYQAMAAASTASGNVVFLGMYEGLWQSSAPNLSFNYIDLLPTRMIRYIHLSPHYYRDQTLFANTYGGGTVWSSNGGASWTTQNIGLQYSYTDASGISPNFRKDSTAFVGDLPGLQETTNQGENWSLLEGLGAHSYPRGLAISPNFAKDHTLLISINAEPSPCASGMPTMSHAWSNENPAFGLFLSTDAGAHWIPSSLGGNAGVSSIAVSPAYASDHMAFAASPVQGLYKSVDGGSTWSLLTLPVSQITEVAVSPAFTTDQTAFASGLSGGIFKSTNAGSTWVQLPQTTGIRALSLAVSPNYARDKLVWAGTLQQGLVQLTKGGYGLTRVTAFPENFVTAVAPSPQYARDHTVFAAAYHGLFKSTDSGASWTYMAEPARIEESRNVSSSLEEPPTIVYQGAWLQFAGLGQPVSTSGYMLTSAAGDTATLFFTGTGVRWVSWTGPGQGSANVELDGVLQSTVSLATPTDMYQQSVFEMHNISCGTHTLTITAMPQNGQTVTLDAFDVWTENCF